MTDSKLSNLQKILSTAIQDILFSLKKINYNFLVDTVMFGETFKMNIKLPLNIFNTIFIYH